MTTKPDERLAIPAKPAAVTAVNVAALAALGVAATGVGGAVVAAGAAVAGGAALARKKGAAKRAARMVSSAGTSTTGKRRATTGSTGRSTGLLGKLASSRRGSTSKSATGSTPARSGRATKMGGAFRSAAGKVGLAKLARTSPSRPSSLAKPSIMKRAASSRAAKVTGLAAAGRGITKAAKWSAPKLGRAIKSAVTAGATTKPNDTKTKPTTRWARARKWFQATILRRKPKKPIKAQPESVAATVARRNRPTGVTVTRSACGGVTVIKHAGRPVPLSATSTTTLITTPGGLAMRDAARQMWNYAASFEPRGMQPVINELEDLPETLSHVAAAVGALMEKSQGKFPLDPVIIAQIGQVVEALYAAAAASKKIPGAVHEIHAADIKRISQPRQGEEMWDLASNGRV